jgi:hypothetical protein
MGPLDECSSKARQDRVDGLEAEALRCYTRQRAVAIALADAVRRAEVATRLEMWLQRQGDGAA